MVRSATKGRQGIRTRVDDRAVERDLFVAQSVEEQGADGTVFPSYRRVRTLVHWVQHDSWGAAGRRGSVGGSGIVRVDLADRLVQPTPRGVVAHSLAATASIPASYR